MRDPVDPTAAHYHRIAPVYGVMEELVERAVFQRWRRELWSRVRPAKMLEVGVGSGRNLAHYPPGARVTAIDINVSRLTRARQRAERLHLDVDLWRMDAQHLEFSDGTFDVAVATFVFCSVSDPMAGLRELGRVVRAGGDIWLLEHMRVEDTPWIGRLMDALNPLALRMVGDNINRRTVENVKRSGLHILTVENLKGELVRLVHAQP